MSVRPAPLGAYLCLGLSMALVGSYVGLSKLLVAVLPVFLLAWLRFGIAAVAMLHWVRRAPGEAPLSRRDRWLLFWESFLGNFLFSICMLFGVALTSAVAAGVIMAAIPAAVVSMAVLRLLGGGAGKSSILENNIVATGASAGSSKAIASSMAARATRLSGLTGGQELFVW